MINVAKTVVVDASSENTVQLKPGEKIIYPTQADPAAVAKMLEQAGYADPHPPLVEGVDYI